jgi:hypothetical protein
MLHSKNLVRPRASIIGGNVAWLSIIIVDGDQGFCKWVGLPMVKQANWWSVVTTSTCMAQGN